MNFVCKIATSGHQTLTSKVMLSSLSTSLFSSEVVKYNIFLGVGIESATTALIKLFLYCFSYGRLNQTYSCFQNDFFYYFTIE